MASKKQDALLESAVDYARAVLETTTAKVNIGKHLSSKSEGKRTVTHFFECLLPGYPGWNWVVVLSRHSRSKEVLVTETDLVAGDTALIAPPWVPWSEREEMQEIKSSKPVQAEIVTDNAENLSGEISEDLHQEETVSQEITATDL
ncbi:MAG: DUF3027 domain-containing protein [Micrococcaceae bacterium]